MAGCNWLKDRLLSVNTKKIYINEKAKYLVDQ